MDDARQMFTYEECEEKILDSKNRILRAIISGLKEFDCESDVFISIKNPMVLGILIHGNLYKASMYPEYEKEYEEYLAQHNNE